MIYAPTVAEKEAAIRAIYAGGGTWCHHPDMAQALSICTEGYFTGDRYPYLICGTNRSFCFGLPLPNGYNTLVNSPRHLTEYLRRT